MFFNPRREEIGDVTEGHAPVTRTEYCRNCVEGNLANSAYQNKGTLEATEARGRESTYSHSTKCCPEQKNQVNYPCTDRIKKQ